ncbi:SH3 domain-containing protein [Domibacillus sp. A3M-37]|uniref:SH3 domain-containing protein n=1 Tax=Domibacillus sp. A3M-37 TaxID=2962037 RepID=UPI0020B76E58|nr:SH3 domain-containing protein [Domibacillus sp. A3M-37]MCP3764600.1 SH3 domain-containing protein [Domibacillus sp. A3M-37]
MKKIIGFIAFLVLMITLLPVQQAEASTGHHTVKVDTKLNVREKPSPRAKVVGSLKNGAVVYVYSTEPGGWSKIKYNNKAGYVASSYLVEQGSYSPPNKNIDYYYYGDWGYSSASNLNVRTAPSKNGKVIGQLQRYEDIYIYGTYSNGWAKVDYYGRTAYVSSDYLIY